MTNLLCPLARLCGKASHELPEDRRGQLLIVQEVLAVGEVAPQPPRGRVLPPARAHAVLVQAWHRLEQRQRVCVEHLWGPNTAETGSMRVTPRAEHQGAHLPPRGMRHTSMQDCKGIYKGDRVSKDFQGFGGFGIYNITGVAHCVMDWLALLDPLVI